MHRQINLLRTAVLKYAKPQTTIIRSPKFDITTGSALLMATFVNPRENSKTPPMFIRPAAINPFRIMTLFICILQLVDCIDFDDSVVHSNTAVTPVLLSSRDLIKIWPQLPLFKPEIKPHLRLPKGTAGAAYPIHEAALDTSHSGLNSQRHS